MELKQPRILGQRCSTVLSAVLCLAFSAASPSAGLAHPPDSLEPVRAAIRTKQFQRAVSELEDQAAHGSADAEYLLGLALFNGIDKEPDRPQALHWLRLAAERGHAQAQFVLADILLGGEKPDAVEARRWLERAAQGGNALAQRALQEKRSPLAMERSAVLADAGLRRDLLLWAARHDEVDSDPHAVGRRQYRNGRRFWQHRIERSGRRRPPRARSPFCSICTRT